MTIDRTKPVEHVDGTPLLGTVDREMARLKREDGKKFTNGQYVIPGEFDAVYTFLDGTTEERTTPLVRNRAAIDLTKPLEVVWGDEVWPVIALANKPTYTDLSTGGQRPGIWITREDGELTPGGRRVVFDPDGNPPKGYEKDAILRNRQPADGFQILRDMGYRCDDEGRWCPPAKPLTPGQEARAFYDILRDKIDQPRELYRKPPALIWLEKVLPAIRAGQDWREVA